MHLTHRYGIKREMGSNRRHKRQEYVYIRHAICMCVYPHAEKQNQAMQSHLSYVNMFENSEANAKIIVMNISAHNALFKLIFASRTVLRLLFPISIMNTLCSGINCPCLKTYSNFAADAAYSSRRLNVMCWALRHLRLCTYYYVPIINIF
jgi:hypothetical protein